MKNMKTKHILPLGAALAMLFAGSVHAADVKVFVDGEQIIFPDVQPTIIESRTYVPLRGVFEKLGYNIEWDDSTKTAALTNEKTAVYANVNDLRIETDSYRRAVGNGLYPIIIDGRMMLPVRAISEASGCDVTWDANTHSVGIFTESEAPSDFTNPQGSGTKTEEDYINGAYALCDEIKHIAAKGNNAALLRFLGRGYENTKNFEITTTNSALIRETANKLYAMDPPPATADIQPFFKQYADILCRFVSITETYSREECTKDEAIAQIDALKEEKDELAMLFSVALNDYFKEKNVFYEGVYGDYVLDMMK
ncbi:MAG: copper amine oxidase N-terminal domain-containing protein [Firmicutes bacterium]|nr:copper amine oxidase N-terminal domain-containing protein [Bacillota bacterium]